MVMPGGLRGNTHFRYKEKQGYGRGGGTKKKSSIDGCRT